MKIILLILLSLPAKAQYTTRAVIIPVYDSSHYYNFYKGTVLKYSNKAWYEVPNKTGLTWVQLDFINPYWKMIDGFAIDSVRAKDSLVETFKWLGKDMKPIPEPLIICGFDQYKSGFNPVQW